MQSASQLRKKPKTEPGVIVEQTEADGDQSFDSLTPYGRNRSQNTSYSANSVSESELVKALSQCILANVSKRGFVRDADIGEIFSDRKEREMKVNVLKKADKLLMNVLGYRFDRDEEGRRYYVSTNLFEGIEMAQEMVDDVQRTIGAFGNDENAFRAKMTEGERYKNCLLETALMFIFMTKRHNGSKTEAEKGVDEMLLRSFLDDLFGTFGREPLSLKLFGELFGPAKSAEFIAHGWLRCDILRDPTTGSDQVSYHWGSRSETVVSKKRILEAFCEIYGTNSTHWPNHARIAGLRGQ